MEMGDIMLEKLNHILNIIMGTTVCVFIGHSIYICWNYKIHSKVYPYSAPWYISILVYGITTLLILLVGVILKFVIKKFMKKNIK